MSEMSRRPVASLASLMLIALAAAACSNVGIPGAANASLQDKENPMTSSNRSSITREVYEAFQLGQLERFDVVVADDVVTNSPGGFAIKGRDALKLWAGEFLKALTPRIDLVDEHDGTVDGEGRAFITVNLNWKHVAPFFDLKPTGREGTSVETFLFTIRKNKIVRWDVADNTLDLAIYLSQRGWPMAHNIRPEPLVRGIERR